MKIKQKRTLVTIEWFGWLNAFNAELSPKRYWHRPGFQEEEEGDCTHGQEGDCSHGQEGDCSHGQEGDCTHGPADIGP